MDSRQDARQTASRGRQSAPERFRLDRSPLSPAELLRVQRAAGNRAAAGLLSRERLPLSVQPMLDVEESSAPRPVRTSGEKVADVGTSPPIDGRITAVFVKRQIPAQPLAVDKDAHTRHWWVVFQVKPDGAEPSWLQVDMINQAVGGYRLRWGADWVKADNLAYEQKEVPAGLTAQEVSKAVREVAATAPEYSNPPEPTEQMPRYSCQTFVQRLLAKLNIAS